MQTHAWFEAAVPGWGWLALDPTNGQLVGERHVTIGHGRSYDDVQPQRGVFLGTCRLRRPARGRDPRVRRRDVASALAPTLDRHARPRTISIPPSRRRVVGHGAASTAPAGSRSRAQAPAVARQQGPLGVPPESARVACAHVEPFPSCHHPCRRSASCGRPAGSRDRQVRDPGATPPPGSRPASRCSPRSSATTTPSSPSSRTHSWPATT